MELLNGQARPVQETPVISLDVETFGTIQMVPILVSMIILGILDMFASCQKCIIVCTYDIDTQNKYIFHIALISCIVFFFFHFFSSLHD